MFKEIGELAKLVDLLKNLDKDFQLNVVIGAVMNYLVRVFRAFKFIILRDYNNRGWLTSDNPVILDKQGNHSWIIPIEAEIYLPLSKDFCLFMYNKNSQIHANPLRNLEANKINKISEEIHLNIWERVVHNKNEFVIFPSEVEKTFFDDVKMR
jgi:hypothetical protein